MQAPIETWAELADPRYREKLVPTGSPGVGGRSQTTPDRGKPNFTVVVCFLLQCYFSLECIFREFDRVS